METSVMPQTEIAAIVASLHKHTVTLSFVNLAVILGILGLFSFVYMHTMQSFQAELSKAEAQDQYYQKNLNDLQTQWKQDQQTIAQLQAQKTKVSTQVIYRDKAADSAIQTVTTPGRDVQQIGNDVNSAYNFPPIKIEGDLFTFSSMETQTFVATKLDRDRLFEDKKDLSKQLDLETQVQKTTQDDLDSTKVLLKSANADIATFKKVTKKSFWVKLRDNTLKVGLFVGGVYLGHKL